MVRIAARVSWWLRFSWTQSEATASARALKCCLYIAILYRRGTELARVASHVEQEHRTLVGIGEDIQLVVIEGRPIAEVGTRCEAIRAVESVEVFTFDGIDDHRKRKFRNEDCSHTNIIGSPPKNFPIKWKYFAAKHIVCKYLPHRTI